MSAAVDSSLIVATGLELTFPGPLRALDRCDFVIPRGQFVAIVGPSGCGKSTLLRLVAGLIAPTAGTLRVAGREPRDARRSATPMAFVFQDPTLLAWRTVAGNIRLPMELAGSARAEREERLRAGLELVGLTEFAERYPAELSGGMRMRVSLARALATIPDLLLLDEPFAALDDFSRQALNEELRRMWRNRGFTALFVTHNIAEAVFLAERVVVISPRPGRIIADFAVPFGGDRVAALRATPEFARLTGEIRAALRRACA